jgi:hypothetical protein
MKIYQLLASVLTVGSVLNFTPSISAADDAAFRKGFGITSFQPDSNGERKIDCRYYTAVNGTNLSGVNASLRAYNRMPDAFIDNSTLESQLRTRALKNHTYAGYEWALTNGDVLNKKNSHEGFWYVQFSSENQIIADVTDAIQIQASDGAAPRLLLNLSIAVRTDKDEKSKVAPDHSWGVATIDVNSIPFYKPEVYNDKEQTFPMYIPQDQTLASITGDKKANQVIPSLKNREEATSHGLKFMDAENQALVDLSLYRECRAAK